MTLVRAYENEPEFRWEIAVGMRKSDDALAAKINEAIDGCLQTAPWAGSMPATGSSRACPRAVTGRSLNDGARFRSHAGRAWRLLPSQL